MEIAHYVLVFMIPLLPLNILLAEDEPSVAFSVSFALKADGHRIEIATDGEQALSKLTAEPRGFNLLITDNNMPRMTGLELVRRVRETPFCGKILVLSAHLSSENRVAYSALRVDGMVPKPFDLHKLRTVIGQIAADAVAIIPSEFRRSRTEVSKLLQLGLPESEELDELVGVLRRNRCLRGAAVSTFDAAVPRRDCASAANFASAFLRRDR